MGIPGGVCGKSISKDEGMAEEELIRIPAYT